MSLARLAKFIKTNKNTIHLSLGEFKLTMPLGQGGNGIVHAASIYEKEVAIKFLITDAIGATKEKKIGRFVSEYFNIMLVNKTTSIVKYIDYDSLKFKDEDGEIEIPVIIMRKYDSSLSKNNETKTEEEFISLFNFLTSTLAEIHNEGIVHRDIKPENILIESKNFVLADFGIAAYNPEMFKIIAETERKERLGNRLFSAPEQEEGGIDAHPTMDIYAMGQVLQWYATGNTHRGTGRKKITDIFPSLGIYDAIINKCLAQNPTSRFHSADEIKEYLKKDRKQDPCEDLYIFNEVCRSNFQRNENSIIFCNDKNKIGQLFQTFKEYEVKFTESLWWVDGTGNFYFTLSQNGAGIWKFTNSEYDITDIWIHYDNSDLNDFVFVHYQKVKPFEFEGIERFYTVIVDKQYQISYSEFQNGFAEINNKIEDLSKHEVEFIERQEEEGFFVIGTRRTCIIQWQNEKAISDFIGLLLSGKRLPTIEELKELQRVTRRHKDDEIRQNL